MFSNNMQAFILINIYVLFVINAFILIAIFYQIIKTKIVENRNSKIIAEISSLIFKHIEEAGDLLELKAVTNSTYRKMIAIDILIECSEKDNNDISEIIEELKLDLFLINKIKRSPNLKYLRKLAFMKVASAYEILLQYSNSEDLDIKYTCYFGLSMLNVEQDKKYFIIHKLVNSDILSDRIIEILNRIKLEFEEWLKLLEAEESEIGKIIFLKILTGREELKTEVYSDRLVKFLKDKKEVRIAAVTAICSSKNQIYIDELYDMFMSEKEWEVRVAITKGMTNFDSKLIKDKLIYMIKDEEWWVRFNAAKAISSMGEEGIYTLIELSIDKNDEDASALAYYFLNSNKDIYETVKNIGG
ncbi:HEAT repeat domain-containing protein [Candidatus Clostridium stratigraminis]|uniref:HEAT repeat domain-containing protein n=1 Tax=Candidatus Clostridium stratigraminis TaxID=3381661 RepID=A0ABW8T1Y4_9CLOT